MSAHSSIANAPLTPELLVHRDSARRPNSGERLLERHGGLIFSVALHLLVASFLLVKPWIIPVDTSKKPEPDRIRVTFAPQPPPQPPVLTPPPLQPDQPQEFMDEAASTGPLADPENAVEDPQSNLPETPPEEPVETTTSPAESPAEDNQEPLDEIKSEPLEKTFEDKSTDPKDGKSRVLTQEEIDFIQAQEKLVSEELDRLTEKQNDQSNTVQMLLMTTAARQAFYTSQGAAEGVARTIDLRDVPKGILDRVLKRNGIEILYKYYEGGTVGNKSPISGVVTNQETYTPRKHIPPGHYEVMEVSATAMRNLARLETEWIEKQGISPLNLRLEKVTYSVMRVGESGHWGLGIKDIEYRELPK